MDPLHSCRGVLSLDDKHRRRIERECCPRHNQDICHGTSPAVTRLRRMVGLNRPGTKKNPRKQGSSILRFLSHHSSAHCRAVSTAERISAATNSPNKIDATINANVRTIAVTQPMTRLTDRTLQLQSRHHENMAKADIIGNAIFLFTRRLWPFRAISLPCASGSKFRQRPDAPMLPAARVRKERRCELFAKIWNA